MPPTDEDEPGTDLVAGGDPARYGLAQPVAYRIVVPEVADLGPLADSLTGLATATQWALAAVCATYVRLPGPGRRAESVTDDGFLSADQFAALGLRGLTSPTTVRRYARRWLEVRQKPEPGDVLDLTGLPEWDSPEVQCASPPEAGTTVAEVRALAHRAAGEPRTVLIPATWEVAADRLSTLDDEVALGSLATAATLLVEGPLVLVRAAPERRARLERALEVWAAMPAEVLPDLRNVRTLADLDDVVLTDEAVRAWRTVRDRLEDQEAQEAAKGDQGYRRVAEAARDLQQAGRRALVRVLVGVEDPDDLAAAVEELAEDGVDWDVAQVRRWWDDVRHGQEHAGPVEEGGLNVVVVAAVVMAFQSMMFGRHWDDVLALGRQARDLLYGHLTLPAD